MRFDSHCHSQSQFSWFVVFCFLFFCFFFLREKISLFRLFGRGRKEKRKILIQERTGENWDGVENMLELLSGTSLRQDALQMTMVFSLFLIDFFCFVLDFLVFCFEIFFFLFLFRLYLNGLADTTAPRNQIRRVYLSYTKVLQSDTRYY